MWKSNQHTIDRQTTRTTLTEGVNALSFRQVLDYWQTNEPFRDFFTDTVSESSFDAFFWETPPITKTTLDSPFEFVCTESALLSNLKPDSLPFQGHFSSNPKAPVLVFPNQGGDAILVVPSPMADQQCYTHLARFLRDAPRNQVHAVWRCLGSTMHSRISSNPTWLSTAGLGVSWLHLRLDSRPKYYRHEPYKTHRKKT